MSVTKGTGHVGNTFVEVEVKRTWRKRKSQVVAEAVGMWEARVVCELSKAVWEERKGLFLFLSFHTAVISIALLSAGSDRLQDELVTIESRRGNVAKWTPQ